MKKYFFTLLVLLSFVAKAQYPNDIIHSGSTGIRSKSTGSFSVVDIDGASGDAALRFAKAGTNQWNIRNRPADDYLEIFELGGGGSRFVIQDGTGNVGIGETTSPSYRLDVLHGGSTGIRNKSSSSFSVIDIDGASGDAAIRFARAGVNQWNLRNRPADDNLEIFELGGGGSRFVVQNGTGNVGIGQDNPVAKVEISGVNSTNNTYTTTSSFTATTIMATKDLNGVGSNKIGIYSCADGGTSQNFGIFSETNTTGTGASYNISLFSKDNINNATSYAGYFIGKVYVSGTLTTTGPKPFTIDHPLDPENKILHHFAIESPDVLNMYSGNTTTDANGKATVKLPDYFAAINKDFRYQLTVIGTFAQAIVSEEIKGNEFVIETSKPNVKVSWEVKATRNDGYMKYVNTMAAEEEKPTYAKGKYYTPEAHQKPVSMGVNYIENEKANISNIRKADAKRVVEGPSSIDDMPIQKVLPKKVVEGKQSTDN
ncbi:hypothetical protein GCM10011514_29040 [Emticicia aquatilis]|uniref:Uncharacterized protein n=1 Tax=Emticicia aquatilis TaxID=1537369 RepID=A0A916YVU6_9BACT|nr:hypothetical protein [Emticicia aquatilis]GGD63203.1 hypothetical protein GCM10011514_29040 [Emticicia aquatilis]